MDMHSAAPPSGSSNNNCRTATIMMMLYCAFLSRIDRVRGNPPNYLKKPSATRADTITSKRRQVDSWYLWLDYARLIQVVLLRYRPSNGTTGTVHDEKLFDVMVTVGLALNLFSSIAHFLAPSHEDGKESVSRLRPKFNTSTGIATLVASS